MGRIAHGPSVVSLLPKSAGGASTGDNYLARILKLIPAEVVASYTGIFNLIDGLPKAWQPNWYWGIVLFFWISTPVVLLLIGKREGRLPSIAHLIISTIAFGVWAYAVSGNVVLGSPLFQPALAGMALLLFTFISGLIPLR
jgi:hypothetical protein